MRSARLCSSVAWTCSVSINFQSDLSKPPRFILMLLSRGGLKHIRANNVVDVVLSTKVSGEVRMWVKSRQRHVRTRNAFHVQETFCSDTLYEENKKSRFRYPAQTKSGLKVVFFFQTQKSAKSVQKYTKCMYVRRWSFDRTFCLFVFVWSFE